MKHVTMLFALLGCSLPATGVAFADGDGAPIPDQGVILLENPGDISDVHQTYGTSTLGELDGDDDGTYFLIQLPPELTLAVFLELASDDPRIDEAEPNYEFCISEINPGTQSFFLTSIVSAYGNQEARGQIGLDRDGYDFPESGSIARGDGVLVAIIDSGIDTDHLRFIGRISPLGVSLIPNDPSIEDAPDGVDNDGDGLTDEIVGHGTFVSGLVTFGAPGATILPIRVLDSDGRSDAFRVARGIEEAVSRGADIINLSLGTTASSGPLLAAVTHAGDHGVVVVASVGNDGAEVVRAPASMPGVLAIAGVDKNDTLTSFSSYGAHVSFTAPAVGVVGPVATGGYGIADGTSYGAPMVAGLAALLLGADPTATPSEIRSWIEAGSCDIDASNQGFDGVIGKGRIDVRATLAPLGLSSPYPAADLDANGGVELADLNRLLSLFGQLAVNGDINDDGQVNLADLVLLLFEFGS